MAHPIHETIKRNRHTIIVTGMIKAHSEMLFPKYLLFEGAKKMAQKNITAVSKLNITNSRP
jgi:hypothetical protein